MAAFPARTWDAFLTHWRTRVLVDPRGRVQTVVVDGQVAGHVVRWEQDGQRLVGYWLGREFWGRGVATAALYPSVSIALTAGLTGVLADLGQPETQRWSAGPLIRWTIPGGVEHARVAIAKAGADAALARFDGAVLGALQDTENALAVYARELDRNAALRAARHEAAEEAHHARSLYRAGRSPYLDDLDARRALTAADAAVAASDNRLALDRVGLFLALGGGWEDVGTNGPAVDPSVAAKAP